MENLQFLYMCKKFDSKFSTMDTSEQSRPSRTYNSCNLHLVDKISLSQPFLTTDLLEINNGRHRPLEYKK